MQTIDISPPANVYATFGRLNYTPWHAIAEFVDNSTQSFFSARERLGVEALPDLTVTIRYDHGKRLLVRDNALGMDANDLARAMRLSAPPDDTSGRSEFGMGLKTAACWFGKSWTVSTTKLGERWRFTVRFDVDAISASDLRSLDIERTPAAEDEHGTELCITDLARPIAGRQAEKTKKLLESIYRVDLASGSVRISWNDTWLKYDQPVLMQREDEATGILADARVPICLTVVDPATGASHRVSGWVGALRTMSATYAGIALLRRGRMIIEGPDWRPRPVVGDPGSHSGKRMVGELHLDDFPVNFTKDGFVWDGGLEEALVEQLRVATAGLRSFAGNARVSKKSVEPQDFVRAVDEVQKALDHPTYIEAVSGAAAPSQHEVLPFEVGDTAPTRRKNVPQELKVPLGEGFLRARLSLSEGGPQESWLSLARDLADEETILVALNTGNRFVAQHLDNESERTLIAKFALAYAAAEAQTIAVFGEDGVPPDELREFLSLTLDNSAL